ncbi:MAG TPA: DUF1801 domain-containing protein [Gemmatimonadales bacterium]|nr:DUF1801 domain-containing protein [Gemmatimonadales bacterium]
MAEAKTKPTGASVQKFLAGVSDPSHREDCQALLRLMRRVTGYQPRMWGPSMVGFGSYRYKYASGREGDWFLTGFSPRKTDLTLYITPGLLRYRGLLQRLGKHKTGKSCLYLKRLADVDLGVLTELVATAHRDIQEMSRPRT